VACGAYSVGLHQADYESCLNYGRYFDSRTTSFTNQFRYGAFEHLEFRGGFTFQNADYATQNGGYGFSNVTLSCKIPIIRDTADFPAIALLGGSVLPYTGNKDFAVTQYLPFAALLVQKSFGSVSIIGNIGIMSDAHVAWDETFYMMNPYSINHKAQGTYALSIYKFQGNIGVFLETYGYYGGGASQQFGAFDLGTTMMIRENLFADFSFGASYNEGLNISFCNWGVGWLIPNKSK
jgi:hypothetical protein